MIFQRSAITFFVVVFASLSPSWWNDSRHAGRHHHHALAQEQEYEKKEMRGGHPNHGSNGLSGLVAGDPLDPPDPSSDVKGDSNGVDVGVGVGASMGIGDHFDLIDPMDSFAVMSGDSDGIGGYDDGVTSYDALDSHVNLVDPSSFVMIDGMGEGVGNMVKGATTSDGKVIDLVSGGQFTPIDPSSFGAVGDGKVLEGVMARTRKLGKGSKGNPTRSRLNECIAALTGTYTFSCCCGGGVYSVTILCDKYDCNYTERNIKATMCPLDTSEPSKCVFSGTFDAREVIDLSTCDVTKMITASYDLPECDISENDFDLNLPEEKFTTPIGLLIQNVLPDDGTIDISFIRKDRSPKKAANVSSSFEERRVEAIRYSDNAEEGHRLLAAASEFEMKALMETHRSLFQCGLEYDCDCPVFTKNPINDPGLQKRMRRATTYCGYYRDYNGCNYEVIPANKVHPGEGVGDLEFKPYIVQFDIGIDPSIRPRVTTDHSNYAGTKRGHIGQHNAWFPGERCLEIIVVGGSKATGGCAGRCGSGCLPNPGGGYAKDCMKHDVCTTYKAMEQIGSHDFSMKDGFCYDTDCGDEAAQTVFNCYINRRFATDTPISCEKHHFSNTKAYGAWSYSVNFMPEGPCWNFVNWNNNQGLPDKSKIRNAYPNRFLRYLQEQGVDISGAE